MPAPLDPAVREAIEQDIREGKSRNAIARAHAVSGSTVTKIAKELETRGDLGDAPAFDRSKTEIATRARAVDSAAERARLRELLLQDAHRLREQLWQPCEMHNFGGKDNTHNSILLDQPTFEQQRAIMATVGTAVDRIIRLDTAEEGAERGGTLLGGLVDEIRASRARRLAEQAATDAAE